MTVRMPVITDWSAIVIEHDDISTSLADIAPGDRALLLGAAEITEYLACPDTGNALETNIKGALHFGDSKPVPMLGARPVLLPDYARKPLSGRISTDDPGLRLFGAQYLHMLNCKANGGAQNSDHTDIWYQRHVFRTRRLTMQARGSLLDIGCDSPSISSALYPRSVHYVGLEPSLTTSTEYCICAMAEHLPFRDASFDNAAFMTSLDHVFDDHRAIDEAFRVIKPGGYLYLASLVWQNNASIIGDTVHFHHFRDWEIQGLLRDFDIDVVQRYSWKGDSHRFGIYLRARKPG
jgi:SAM-dependent methyltransferase